MSQELALIHRQKERLLQQNAVNRRLLGSSCAQVKGTLNRVTRLMAAAHSVFEFFMRK